MTPQSRTLRKVLNASRHHRKNRSLGFRIDDPSTFVLNASRHHRKNRASVSTDFTMLVPCSTPRGITGKIAQLIEIIIDFMGLRAQRLAASPEKSLNQGLLLNPIIGCSTPRGITGKIARAPATPMSTSICAQRLAASPEKSHTDEQWNDACDFVLNASRHHRKNRPIKNAEEAASEVCSTPRGITGKIAPSQERPLMAYPRAQRLAASPEKSLLRERRNDERHQVLNASRHHRKNRCFSCAVCVPCSACSTPRGITGKIALPQRGCVGVISGVLNASRHHRKNRCLQAKLRVRLLNRAQRLAASPEKSRGASRRTS